MNILFLRELARLQPCMIRIPGICNHNPETTVLAHFRMSSLSGFGFKPPDLIGAWACSACHLYVDTNHDPETQLAFAKGVFRTLNYLIQKEIIHVRSTAD